MAKATLAHWGLWLSGRAEVVGFRRQQDFADAVGCSRTQLTKWLNLAAPPKHMRKGFDAMLARALQTTGRTLFEEWSYVPPERADRVLLHADQFFAQTRDEPLLLTDVDHLLIEVSRRLYYGEVERVLEFAVGIVLTRNDERAAEFREIAERFKMYTARERRMIVTGSERDPLANRAPAARQAVTKKKGK